MKTDVKIIDERKIEDGEYTASGRIYVTQGRIRFLRSRQKFFDLQVSRRADTALVIASRMPHVSYAMNNREELIESLMREFEKNLETKI